ncbi:MAG: hypothetical protein KBC84_02365 [Proteobacteria bacterium]|nr:hypothetical protein [Pseudomonadota bacterium]
MKIFRIIIILSLSLTTSCDFIESESFKTQKQVMKIANELGLFQDSKVNEEESEVGAAINSALEKGSEIVDSNPEIVSTLEDVQRFGFEVTDGFIKNNPEIVSQVETSFSQLGDSVNQLIHHNGISFDKKTSQTSKSRIINNISSNSSDNGKSHTGLKR